MPGPQDGVGGANTRVSVLIWVHSSVVTVTRKEKPAAGRASAVPVRMTIKRHRKLRQIIAAWTSPQRLVLRARIVLGAAEGAADAAIARDLRCSVSMAPPMASPPGRMR